MKTASGNDQAGSDSPDLDDAWRIIQTARDHDWSKAAFFDERIGGRALRIYRGGRHEAERSLDASAAELLDCFLPLVAHAQSLVIGQIGQSLDGRIATESGASHYINGLPARVHLHRLRALVDAVVIGAGTAIADLPQLTVRHVPGRNPARVVLDPSGRVPATGPLFEPEPAASAPVTLRIVGIGARPDPSRVDGHAKRLELDTGQHGFDPHELLALLQRAGYRRVLIEGGGVTVSRFFQAQALDRLHLLVAPLLIGSGRSGLVLDPIDTLDQATRAPLRRFNCGDDTIFDLALQRRK
ncbi:MAG: RibD family protein [Wenzhouxiangellaceae bacterium]|nr:RibD family protein [Wenzhouxiangellaceae bacterium]